MNKIKFMLTLLPLIVITHVLYNRQFGDYYICNSWGCFSENISKWKTLYATLVFCGSFTTYYIVDTYLIPLIMSIAGSFKRDEGLKNVIASNVDRFLKNIYNINPYSIIKDMNKSRIEFASYFTYLPTLLIEFICLWIVLYNPIIAWIILILIFASMFFVGKMLNTIYDENVTYSSCQIGANSEIK